MSVVEINGTLAWSLDNFKQNWGEYKMVVGREGRKFLIDWIGGGTKI